MSNLTNVADLQSLFRTVNLGDWSNDQDVPWWLAQIILPAAVRELSQVHAGIQQAVSLARQDKMDFAADVLEDICPLPRKLPPSVPPRPRWFEVLAELGRFADSLPETSAQRAAAFKLMQVSLDRFSKQLQAKVGCP